jgi:glycogen phosphorylase
LTTDDVQVQLYQGAIDAHGQIIKGKTVLMQPQGQDEQGHALYGADTAYSQSGLQGLSLRVLPQHAGLSSPYELGLITWATPDA